MRNPEARPPLLLLLLLLAQDQTPVNGQWVMSDGTALLDNFSGSALPILNATKLTGRILISNCMLGQIETDTLRVGRGITDGRLEIVNTKIDQWQPNQLDAFENITIDKSSIRDLRSGGISIIRPDAESCVRVRKASSVRITRTQITTLHEGGIVLKAANGALELDGSNITTLNPGGVQLTFRVRFKVTNSRIDKLEAGAFCQVCSDVINFHSSHIQPSRPVEAALSFGTPACLDLCPRQRLHIHRFEDMTLTTCDAAVELIEPLRRCRLRQSLVTRCGGRDGDSSDAACGDLKLLANRSDCSINSTRLVQLLQSDPWWTEPAFGATTAAALAVGFLLGLLTLRFCCRRRRHQRREGEKEKQRPESGTATAAPVRASSQSSRSPLWRLRASSSLGAGRNALSSNMAEAGSLHNIYEQPSPPEGIYEQIVPVRPPAVESSLPRPPSPAADETELAQLSPKRRFPPPLTLPKPRYIYENLHGNNTASKKDQASRR